MAAEDAGASSWDGSKHLAPPFCPYSSECVEYEFCKLAFTQFYEVQLRLK